LRKSRQSRDYVAVRDAACELGSMLFWIEGSELEAVELLREALALSRYQGDRAAEIDALLGLGTAWQYCGERLLAVVDFRLGLTLCAMTGIGEKEHFLLHHLGRCLVEMGELAEAKEVFEKALVIRETLPNKRFAESTRGALADVAKM